jgi:hypothetical protein
MSLSEELVQFVGEVLPPDHYSAFLFRVVADRDCTVLAFYKKMRSLNHALETDTAWVVARTVKSFCFLFPAGLV